MSAIPPLAVAAMDNGRVAPDLAVSIARGKSAKSIGSAGAAARHEWRNQKIDGCRSLRHH
jgi:hypothetical protein